MKRDPFRQLLPALDLSIERYTKAVPDDGAWYLVRAGEQLGRFRTLQDAKTAWAQVLQESGWTPTKRDIDPRQALTREAEARWARNRGG